MQDVWRRPATGRSAWERSCPPRGSDCVREGPHRCFAVRPFTASGHLERAAQIFHPPPGWVHPPGLLHRYPKQAGRRCSPWKWGWRSCACAAECWGGSTIGLGPEGGGGHYGQGSFAQDPGEERTRIWPDRAPEDSLGRRTAELKLVSAQHSDGHRDTRTHRAATRSLALCKRGAPAAWLQPCQACREGPCAQPHRSTFVQKG